MSQAKEQIVVVDEPGVGVQNAPITRGSLWAVVAGWGRYEGRQWRRAFFTPATVAILAVTLILLTLAWQVPFGYTLDTSTELNLDQPFLSNFDNIEPAPNPQHLPYYRWSHGDGRLEFKGIGARAYRLQLTMAGGINPKSDFVLYANGVVVGQGRFEPAMKSFSFDIPASAVAAQDGDLNLRVAVNSFVPKEALHTGTDQRVLGFVFYSAKLDPADTGLAGPPLGQLALLTGVVMLLYALLGRAGFAGWWAAGGAAIGLVAMAGVIATPGVRPWLTIFSPQLLYAFGGALLLIVGLDIWLRRVWQHGWERAWTLSFVGLAFALRLAATLHPHAGGSIVDLGFHVNRLAALYDQHLWWDKIRSTEWGDRLTYYPHTTHFLAGLFQWLIPDRRLLLLTWMQAFEASRVALVFFLVKRVTGDGRSAVFAAFLMAALPINMLSLAWGQVANLFAEWLVLVSLSILVVRWQELRRPVYFGLLTLALWASFITHPGEVLLSGMVFLGVGVVLWRVQGWRLARVFLAAYGLSIVLAFASYHWVTVQDMIPQALDTLSGKGTGGKATGSRTGGSVGDARLGFIIQKGVTSLSQRVTEDAKGFWREIRVYFDVFPVLLMPFGLAWLWRRSRQKFNSYGPMQQRLFWAGIVWIAVALLFAIVGAVLNLYVRYSLFMLPFVAIGAGIFLGRLWQRPRWGWANRLLVIALCVWIAVGTLTLLLDRVIYYLHGL